MLEPPSAALLKALSALKLCTPHDLRRCRGVVRRVTRDLPTFDSIWIDALVQKRRLTPFQAGCLEAGRAEQLAIGPCLLLERLGKSPFAETFLARQRDAHEVCVLKLNLVAADQAEALRARLERLTQVHRHSIHPGIVGPHALQTAAWPTAEQSRLVSISRYIAGPHLAELLIRRGRFPIPIVLEIGRELTAALAALEPSRVAHGDISLTNVRIMPSGQAVLVDAGLVPALRPEFSFHTMLSAERYDGLAPERISGAPPNSVSDLYSLGCMLWQLLAGRPPFLAGDPLAKLAAHQTKPIPDVRDCVPDAPAELAEMLGRWTSLSPASRPKSFREAAAEIGAPTRSGRRLLTRFRGEFDRSLPRNEQPTERSGWPIVAASLLVLAGAAVPLSNPTTRGTLLSWIRPKSVTADSDALRQSNEPAVQESPIAAPLALPPVSSAGQIQLARSGRFIASELSTDGELQLIGDPRGPAEIIVDDQSLRLTADRITLKNVRLVRAESSGHSSSVPLVVAESQVLEVRDSTLLLSDDDSLDAATDPNRLRRPAAIAWRPRETSDRSQSQITLTDCVVAGAGPALYLAQSPAEFHASNVLKAGSGDLIQWIDAGKASWNCSLRQVTVRNRDAWLRCWPRSRNGSVSRVNLSATGCVWDVPDSTSSADASERPLSVHPERPAFVTWMSSRLPTSTEAVIQWNCSGVLIPPHTDIAAVIDPSDGQRTVVDDSRWNLDGVVATRCEFVGPASSIPRDSELKSCDAPRSGHIHYGINSPELPVLPKR